MSIATTVSSTPSKAPPTVGPIPSSSVSDVEYVRERLLGILNRKQRHDVGLDEKGVPISFLEWIKWAIKPPLKVIETALLEASMHQIKARLLHSYKAKCGAATKKAGKLARKAQRKRHGGTESAKYGNKLSRKKRRRSAAQKRESLKWLSHDDHTFIAGRTGLVQPPRTGSVGSGWVIYAGAFETNRASH